MELNKELIEKAKKYISNEGYGIGTNFTTNTVANLMAEFAVKINSNESNEFRTIGNNENTQEKCSCNCSREINIINGKHICTKCNKPL